jgi:hypothetical protein
MSTNNYTIICNSSLCDLGLLYKGLNISHFLTRYALYNASFFKLLSIVIQYGALESFFSYVANFESCFVV